ncbi:guanine deaminase [Durotheca rogersii]|uniref:guanine deaminase n=1 Tax=Durotheca rogersii TaxID=419775 RepID=UPI002221127A|nr:guanine deaminase [Durotheca rogersii]KAI5867027.1 guanine deaminase [Durotheca rogersii]
MAASPSQKNQLFLGLFIHSIRLGELQYLHDAAVCVDKGGKIVAVELPCDQEKAEDKLYPSLGWTPGDVLVTAAKDGQFFFPGFVDTHLHAPQYPNVGIFGKSTLLDWLNTYTFPMEASMAELPRARRVYARCVRRTLAHGTTTAAYFATIDVAATNLLADLCLAAGQRAFVGRVCMDRLGPEYYLDASPAAAAAAARASIDHIRTIDPGFALVSPVLTPRFAPACSAAALAELGALRRETGLPVQTHVSENADEVALVARLFPGHASYAEVYDAHGLLEGGRTILAHAVHLTDAEADLVARRRAGVAHCPCSNTALTSGEAPVRWLLDKGIAVGLGTDMSGGYSPSVLEAARQTVLVSNHLAMPAAAAGVERAPDSHRQPPDDNERARAKLSVEEVLHLATRGGAEVVGLSDRVGGFEAGKEWDAQLIGLAAVPDGGGEEDGGRAGAGAADEGNVDVFGWETWEDRVAKWVFGGDDRNVRKVWVRGRLVHSRSPS